MRRRRSLTETNGERWSTETVYAITSLTAIQARPAELAAIVRGHWLIEDRLHWVRDVTYDEDRSRVRTGDGPRVMASLPATWPSPSCASLEATSIAVALHHHVRRPVRPPHKIMRS